MQCACLPVGRLRSAYTPSFLPGDSWEEEASVHRRVPGFQASGTVLAGRMSASVAGSSGLRDPAQEAA